MAPGSSLTMFLSSPGRRYGSVDSAANGRSDAESGSESSRRTSRQPSLESRRSLDLSDRWVATCAVCRVPSQSAVVGPCSHGEANTSPGKGGLVPRSPPRIGLLQGQHWGAPGVPPALWCSLLLLHPGSWGDISASWSRLLALQLSGSTAARSLSCQRVWDWALGDSNATPCSWSPARVCLSGQKPHAVIWDPAMCQGPLSQLWPRSGWGGVGFPGMSCVSCIPVPQMLLPKVPGSRQYPSQLGLA